MTRKNVTTFALALALVMTVAGFASAGPGGQGYHGRGGCGAWSGGPACGNGGPGLRGIYSQLTPEKKAAVDKIFESYRGKFDAVRNELETKHAVLEAMVNGGQADEKKIGKVVSDMSGLRDKMVDLRKDLRADLSKELGIELPETGFGRGCPGFGSGNGPDDCPGYGPGQGRGMRGDGPRWQ
ncbi:Spy/CpxP family protein refolding chaperone [Pseudodesulfovibrio sp.]|uniref:Spy/CpxP family protein refolding chaperone n=1 Tax=Pseudodesulfovibrio sp. TaxID=2035812 RepID=UPI002618B092|nr:Spy/CpxP family protein refolding chaperone [Pseudodesulfovibrio sp.]MDD3310751.1 Spy/CpxP family protein refolding chaperone [Pseudodesulfovibrio sp.]